jgi:phospholipid/cholesterol/gamma-HCH transport system ATP-binding protein
VSDIVIEARDVHKRFGANTILNGVSFALHAGERVVILGRSGGGKSVLLRHLVGLVQPDSGSIRLFGQELVGLPRAALYALRLQVGVLFQGAALLDSMNVYENITLGLRTHTTLDEAALRERAAIKLAEVGLPGIEKVMPASLSGGMRKRVGLARAVAMDPRIILYDEPTTGLDPVMSDVINNLILQYGRRPRVTSVIVTHDMTSALKIGTRFVMLHKGQAVFDGDAAALRACRDPRIAGFIAGEAAALEHLQ